MYPACASFRLRKTPNDHRSLPLLPSLGLSQPVLPVAGVERITGPAVRDADTKVGCTAAYYSTNTFCFTIYQSEFPVLHTGSSTQGVVPKLLLWCFVGGSTVVMRGTDKKVKVQEDIPGTGWRTGKRATNDLCKSDHAVRIQVLVTKSSPTTVRW